MFGLTACGGPVCPSGDRPSVLGPPGEADLDELSGLAQGDAFWWTHNDGDAQREAIALDEGGHAVGRVLLPVEPVDLEDVAVERLDEATWVWLGDLGDNDGTRASVAAYGFREPSGDLDSTPVDVVAVTWSYPDGRARDAETLLIDPWTSDRVVVTRARGEGATEAFSVPSGGISRELDVLDAPALAELDDDITGGDISPDGTRVALRSGAQALLWVRSAETTLSSLWQRPPDCTIDLVPEEQGEGIAFGADGLRTISEGAEAPLYHYAWP